MRINESTILNLTNNMFSNNAGDDAYKPKKMLDAYIKNMQVSTFFIKNFFSQSILFDTEEVDMDFYKDKRSVAPFVFEGVESVNTSREGFITKRYKTPYIGINTIYDRDVLNKRLPGELEYAGLTPDERAVTLQMLDYVRLDNMITRREELMCAELLQTGIVTIEEYSLDKTKPVNTAKVEYDKNKCEQLTGDKEWSNANADIYGMLEKKALDIRQAGYNPEVIIIGHEAWSYMLKNKSILDALDNRRINLGSIDPTVMSNESGEGYSYLGQISGPIIGNLQMYSHNAWYNKSEGELTPYLDPNTVIITPKNIGEMLYGAITIIPHPDSSEFVTYVQKRVPKISINHYDNIKQLSLYSRPLPKISDVDMWTSIKVVV